jgi:shikimate kinase
MIIFIIGPGGVGKSTSGKILAEKLGYKLIDLDLEFLNQVGDIGSFIDSFGYTKYSYTNSELFYSLLNEGSKNTVFILSSGFLVHKGLEELVHKHAKTLQAKGTSILLLPSRNINETVEIVVKRQINRGIGLKEKNERVKIKERFSKYLNFGDIKIYSHDSPENIAEEMKEKLTTRLAK